MSSALHRPLLIGVTGGIGVGKSTVCTIFQALGIPVYKADERARWLVENDVILKAAILRLLGPGAYDLTGHYNRSWVASQVFNQPKLLDELNALIHPKVYTDTDAWVRSHPNKPYIVKEAAIMRAAGDGNRLDKVVVVQAPLALRLQRVLQRDSHRTEQEVLAIIKRQANEEERLTIADYVIYNDERQLLIPQVLRLHDRFAYNDFQ